MGNENSDKSKRGKNGEKNLGALIKFLKKNNYIKSYKAKYRNGYEGINTEQFYFQYLVEFEDMRCWLLQSTTSVRNDRMGIHQWNSFNLKNIDSTIEKSYVIVPDTLSEAEQKEVDKYKKKINSGSIYTAVDGVLTQNELYLCIEEYASTLSDNAGQFYAKVGTNFEKWLADVLNNTDNLYKWKNEDKTLIGCSYDYYIKVIKAIGLCADEVLSIHATVDIPNYENGGKPKTDLMVQVAFIHGANKGYTFSCKKTTKKRVTVHDYTAEQFINALEIEDADLINALYDFQNSGCMKDMSKNNLDIMNKKMPAYNDKLARWVFSGDGMDIRSAQYLITYQSLQGEFDIHTIEEYIEIIKDNNIIGNFGTFFNWTYPSKKRGKRIQLKMAIM